jgi:tRNA(Arg) A34 adenosine deaminase TadA
MVRDSGEFGAQPVFPGQLTARRIGELIGQECRQAAAQSILEGNASFGCVFTDLTGNTLVTGHNTSRTNPNSVNNSDHAEMNAESEYARLEDDQDLANLCVFSNAISCAMCFDHLLEQGARRFFYGDYCSVTSQPWLSLTEMRDRLIAAPNGAEDGWLVVGIFSSLCRPQIEVGRLALVNPMLRGALEHDARMHKQTNELGSPVVMRPALSPGTEHFWLPGIQAWPAEGAVDDAFLARVGAHYDDKRAYARHFVGSPASSAY